MLCSKPVTVHPGEADSNTRNDGACHVEAQVWDFVRFLCDAELALAAVIVAACC
jgi:hypothetical protein